MKRYIVTLAILIPTISLLHSCFQKDHHSLLITNPTTEYKKHLKTLSYQVSALLDERNKVFCSGVFISKHHLLTAAHCVYDRQIEGIKLGAWNTESKSFDHFSSVASIEFLVPDIGSMEFPNFDVAIIELTEPLQKQVRPMPISSSIPIGSPAYVAGFGLTASKCDDSDTDCLGSLLVTQVDLVEHTDNSRFHNIITIQGDETGPCMGDSGGPIFQQTETGYALIGITSGVWHVFNSEAFQDPEKVCESGSAIITSIVGYHDWIKHLVNDKKHKFSPPSKTQPKEHAIFAEWCRYDNIFDPAWRTTQSLMYLISRYAGEIGYQAKQVFSNCQLAQSIAESWLNSYDWLEFDRSSTHVSQALPINALKPKNLGFYFNDIENMNFELMDSVENLLIEASSIDQKSFCTIAFMPSLVSLELSYLRTKPELSCLKNSRSLETLIVNGENLDFSSL